MKILSLFLVFALAYSVFDVPEAEARKKFYPVKCPRGYKLDKQNLPPRNSFRCVTKKKVRKYYTYGKLNCIGAYTVKRGSCNTQFRRNWCCGVNIGISQNWNKGRCGRGGKYMNNAKKANKVCRYTKRGKSARKPYF